MKKIVLNKSYNSFCVSHQAFLRLRELGQQDALTEMDLGAYSARVGDAGRTEPQSVRKINPAG